VKRAHGTDELPADNVVRLRESLSTKQGLAHFLDLLILVADVLDLAAAGEDVWLSIGHTKSHNACLLTVHDGGEVMTASGTRLEDLAAAAGSFL